MSQYAATTTLMVADRVRLVPGQIIQGDQLREPELAELLANGQLVPAGNDKAKAEADAKAKAEADKAPAPKPRGRRKAAAD